MYIMVQTVCSIRCKISLFIQFFCLVPTQLIYAGLAEKQECMEYIWQNQNKLSITACTPNFSNFPLILPLHTAMNHYFFNHLIFHLQISRFMLMPFTLVLWPLKFPHILKTNFQNGSTKLWGNSSNSFSSKPQKMGLKPAFIVLFNQTQGCFLDRILRKFLNNINRLQSKNINIF